jgi:serine/threonine protein kinase
VGRPDDGSNDSESTQRSALEARADGHSRYGVGHQVGPYCLLKFLGRGVFGEVWLAERDSPIARSRLAVKLPTHTSVDLDVVRKEAEIWIRVSNHPNVLPIFEANVYDGQVMIVSEYAPDGSLRDWLARHGGKAPSADAAVAMITGVLSGLGHLHAQGVIHRDLKPANVLLQGENPRLADFGLSRVTDNQATASQVAGTPAYMAPEAFAGRRSVQTDLWAVGVILHELVAGTRPFPQDDMMSLIWAITVSDPATLPIGTPPHIERVVRKCLQKDPADRYDSVGELLADLRSCGAIQTTTHPPGPRADGRGQALLHRLWDDLDADLQDALALAYNQARREKKDRISTRTFFAALERLQPGRLPELLGALPEGSMPGPVAEDVPLESRVLEDSPKLSSCVENALVHLGASKPPGHKLVPEEVFVDIAKFGTGPSVLKLRTHGVTPDLIDRFVGQFGWKVVGR